MSDIGERLAELERLGLNRRLRLISGPQGPTVLLDGRPVLLLCSNNYLGLADHPSIREAAADAAMRWGVGAGASRLVSGTMTIHRRLEESLAEFEGSEACILFGSGYLANLGVISALAGRGQTVYSDELNHASIIDGCRLSRAEVVVYKHGDVEHLRWCMDRVGDGDDGLIVTDSVFSMDGDIAPLAELCALARSRGARIVVDEAHATGNLGPGGRGAVAEAGLTDEVDVVVGTLGKALGSYGAYACASREMVRLLINCARPLIFSTAPPPPAVAGALAALELLRERPQRVARLRSAAMVLRQCLAGEGFPVQPGEMHIIPLIVGAEDTAMRLCQEAIERGVFAQAIRPPTVPAGTSRLRLTVMASHSHAELQRAARALGDAARAIGLDPAGAPGTELASEFAWEDAGDEPSPGRRPAPDPVQAAIEREAFPARGRAGAAPFAGDWDLEPDVWEPARAARGERDATAPFDVEREPIGEAFSFDELPRLEGPEGAPFDFERDVSRDLAA